MERRQTWEGSKRPEVIKTIVYVVYCAGVALLAAAAYPRAEKAGLLPALFAGMATSVAGLGLRWLSYEVEAPQGIAGCRDGRPSAPRGSSATLAAANLHTAP